MTFGIATTVYEYIEKHTHTWLPGDKPPLQVHSWVGTLNSHKDETRGAHSHSATLSDTTVGYRFWLQLTDGYNWGDEL